MNLVGKILIVLIFIQSVLFVGFAVAIYASHTNWKTAVDNPKDGWKVRLEEKEAENSELSNERDRLSKERDTAELAQREVLAELHTKVDEPEVGLKAQLAKATNDLAARTQDVRDATATLGENHKTLAALRGEVDKLRAEIRQEQQEKDNAFSKVMELTDQQHDLANELAMLQARNRDLAEDYAGALEVLRKHDLKPIPAVYAGEADKVDGLVKAVRNTGLIEVSIGKDDGLLPGHTLEVYRVAGSLSSYLGKVEVTQVEPSKAACKILPEFQKGTIQRGDRVASKLK